MEIINKINERKVLWSFLVVAILLIVGFLFTNRGEKDTLSRVTIAGQEIKVALALTPLEHEQGLSGRAQLEEDEGMLFVFDTPDKYGIWMKDMNFPIDIIWLGEDSKIVSIKKDAKPESFPEAYGPNADAKYVLEVVSGFSDKNNVQVGDSVEIKIAE